MMMTKKNKKAKLLSLLLLLFILAILFIHSFIHFFVGPKWWWTKFTHTYTIQMYMNAMNTIVCVWYNNRDDYKLLLLLLLLLLYPVSFSFFLSLTNSLNWMVSRCVMGIWMWVCGCVCHDDDDDDFFLFWIIKSSKYQKT